MSSPLTPGQTVTLHSGKQLLVSATTKHQRIEVGQLWFTESDAAVQVVGMLEHPGDGLIEQIAYRHTGSTHILYKSIERFRQDFERRAPRLTVIQGRRFG